MLWHLTRSSCLLLVSIWTVFLHVPWRYSDSLNLIWNVLWMFSNGTCKEVQYYCVLLVCKLESAFIPAMKSPLSNMYETSYTVTHSQSDLRAISELWTDHAELKFYLTANSMSIMSSKCYLVLQCFWHLFQVSKGYFISFTFSFKSVPFILC